MKAMHSRCIEPQIEELICEMLNVDFNSYERKLNLACGADYKHGWTNLDNDARVIADVGVDLDTMHLYDGEFHIGLPFESGMFDLIYAAHILEHITHLQELKTELYRILKPGGDLVCIVPHYLSVDAWGNPTHCRAFSLDSFHVGQFWPGEYQQEMRLFDLPLNGENGYSVTWIISKRTKVK
jgi:predicted SAM-dependent methyltransferase